VGLRELYLGVGAPEEEETVGMGVGEPNLYVGESVGVVVGMFVGAAVGGTVGNPCR